MASGVFLEPRNRMQILGTLQAVSDSGARRINNLGQVIGTSDATTRRGTNLSLVSVCSLKECTITVDAARDINDNGQIAEKPIVLPPNGT
jgi:uncharacterized membrane protein